MHSTAQRPHMVSRIAGAIIWAFALVAAVAVPAAAAPEAPDGPAPGPLVVLNDYCQESGAVGQLEDGRTAYCTPVANTDAFVWSYSRNPMPRDPNTREYSCTENGCNFPDGSEVPAYQRCGILCGEPPTSGDVQSGLDECFRSGAPFEECEGRLNG
ncbi:hypothetical protein [Nocardia sp. NPDC019395]|uniref:hypothetical protein n=1 Tax=Nocardia sp. NPDC019395 TaxID=3154686 RepID=UPI00340064D5